MSETIQFNDSHDGYAIAKRAGTSFNSQQDISIGRVRDGVLLGGVVFCNYTGESIGIHSASWDDHWINRDMLWVTFHYPFVQLGVKRIFGQVAEDNERARRFNEKLGFKHVARIEGVYRHNVACLVMCMERDECRFLNLQPRHIGYNRIN